jgi:hormone-sensitive lipase
VDVSKEVFSVQGLQDKVQSAVLSVKSVIIKNTATEEKEEPGMKRNYAFAESNSDRACLNVPVAPEDEFVFSVPRNYLMSPYLAPDSILKKFPKTHILTTLLDPCIDDCVEFAKKLRSLDVDVQLDILKSLNHGFLNFANVSKNS